MKIQGLGITHTDENGEVKIIMFEGTIPADCVLVFIKKDDYDTLLELMKEKP